MKGFYHIWAWRPSWSCDLDFLYTHWFPLPIDASYKIWLWLAKRFQRRRSLKLWTDGRTDGRRTDDGRTPDHGHPISSPCEPNGSGKLKNRNIITCIYKPVLLYISGIKGTCFPDDLSISNMFICPMGEPCKLLCTNLAINFLLLCIGKLVSLKLKLLEPVHEKTNNLGSDQVRHKPGCTVTEDG